MKIRNAEEKDLEEITKIYNNAIKNSIATFDTEEKTLEEQKKWFKKHGPKNPIIVAELNKNVIGFASLTQYSTRCAYSDTAELSLYLKEDFRGKGFGKKLMIAIVNEGKKAGLHTVISRITDGNEISVHLHKITGFNHVGIYKEAGCKFGKRLDVVLMQKVYE